MRYSRKRDYFMDDTTKTILFILALILIFLFTRRWFWKIALFFGGLASLFAMIASIIYFQILAAIGFFVLMVVCWSIKGLISED